MTEQKGKLFELANACKKYKRKKKTVNHSTAVSGKHYDEGKSISLSFNLDTYQQSIYDSYRHNDPSVQLTFEDDLRSEAFYVEPFENGETIQVDYELMSESNDLLEKVVNAVEDASEELKTEEVYEEEAEEGESREPVSKEQSTSSLETGENMASAPTDSEENIVKTEKTAAEEDDRTDNDEFAEDIKAILQGQKIFEPKQKRLVNRSEASGGQVNSKKQRRGSRQEETEDDDTFDPSKNEHKIFEKIAQSMRYANSYDLGSIAMEKKFDEIENELEEVELKKIINKNEIEEALVINEENNKGSEKEEVTTDNYNSGHLLTLGNGGRVIEKDNLQIADILLITTPDPNKAATCYAGIYTGNNQVIMADKENLLKKRSLEDSLADSRRAIVLRYKNDTDEAVQSVLKTLSKASEVSGEQEAVIEVIYPPVEIHQSFCKMTPASDREKCQLFKGKIDLGTADNDRFYMPNTILQWLQSSALDFIDSNLNPLTADKNRATRHNGQWQYAGHLN